MAKSSSQANGTKSGTTSVTPKKTAWKGISLKSKSPSRPASVNSQESRKSTHTIGSIDKPVASPLSAEFEASSAGNESATTLDAVEPDTTNKVATKSNEPTNDISSPIHTKDEIQAKDEDDGTSTPRAGSRRSSFTALDSASEVFEDAFDDHDDYFDDVPVFEDHQGRDQMDSALSALEKDIDKDTKGTGAFQENPVTMDEIESLRIAETPSTTQRKQDEEPKAHINGVNGNVSPTIGESKSQTERPTIEQPDQSLSNVSQEKSQEPYKSTDNSVTTATKETSDNLESTDHKVPISLSQEQTQEHRVADVLADLENTEASIKAFEFPTIDIDSARGGDTSEKSPIDHTDSGVFDAKSSEEKSEPTRNTSFSDSLDKKSLEMDRQDRLGSLLPAMEDSARETIAAHPRPPKAAVDNANITSEDHARAARSHEFEHPIEDPIDLDMFRDNIITIPTVDAKSIPINYLTPREQEEADEPVREGMRNLFDNKFMKAKNAFQAKASVEPLHALGLGSMAFIKAMMTYQEKDVDVAMTALATAYTIAKAQIDNTQFKKPLKEAVSQCFSAMLARNNASGLPSNPAPITRANGAGVPKEAPTFLPNGILRAHVIKAECCLLMSILQLSQESVVSYLKCGLNLRRAYNNYSIVWQEYKRMGQEFTKHMDRDTVSAIQFGIGAVHLMLSSMPAKILKIFSTLGWQSDKQLGFALLKLCLEGRGIRSPLASLTLLSYYSVLTSFAPQIYSKELMGPAIECLLDAQKSHPSSCFFLFFAARIARVASNLPLSTQSFNFAVESSRGEWAETAMKQMADYEIGFNLALQLDWEGAAAYFEQLSRERYWSPAFSRYFVGACREMLGDRTECILAFAEVPQLAKEQQSRKTYIDAYVQKKVEFFQKSGYQDMDFSLPGLEILLVWNAFEQMEPEILEKCLEMVHRTLELIYEREKMEYTIRLRELVPKSTPPDYYDQRAVLLLTKASLLNALGRYNEGIAHLNWVMDHKDCIKFETWVVPFAYWEAGVTSWGLGNIKKSRKLWQMALSCNKYDFEYRMAVRLSLALSKCDEIGVKHVEPELKKGHTTNGRKRMPITDP